MKWICKKCFESKRVEELTVGGIGGEQCSECGSATPGRETGHFIRGDAEDVFLAALETIYGPGGRGALPIGSTLVPVAPKVTL